MAENKLTPKSDLATREFFKVVSADAKYLQDSPAHRRQILAILLEALNYQQLPNGAFVSKDTSISMEFGSRDYSRWPDEWADDEEKAHAAINTKDTTKASARRKAKNPEVRKAVLPEDVR